jgi:tetratricopeptide (TPR) repeat protein
MRMLARSRRISIAVALCRAVTTLLFGCINPLASHAAAFTPSSGDEVLERLPSRSTHGQRLLQQARAALAANPNDLAARLELAQRYIDNWRDGGDPRNLGYAQAALKPWWNMQDPPPGVRVMRATLLQSMHRFQEALIDLDAVVAHDRRNAQAWLTRATVLQVLGDYPQAIASCAQLFGLAPNLITVTCLSETRSLNGHAYASYRQLDDALTMAGTTVQAPIRRWALTLLAEIAVRRGETEAARAHFIQALTLGIPDNYLLGAYADFLLDTNRPEQVVALLQNRTQADALLLRYAIALKTLGRSESVAHIDMLRQRFDAARMRGDTIHQREHARFMLVLANDPVAALPIAQENWLAQKEPADTLLLLESAAAVGNQMAARPVIEWVRKVKLEDQKIKLLIAQLGEPAK